MFRENPCARTHVLEKGEKTVCFSREKCFAFIFKDNFFQSPYVLSVFFRPRLFREGGGRLTGQALVREAVSGSGRATMRLKAFACSRGCFGNIRFRIRSRVRSRRVRSRIRFRIRFCIFSENPCARMHVFKTC